MITSDDYNNSDVAKAFELTEEPRRHQTLFYLDDDLKQILDRIPKGKKSFVINRCIRHVLTEMGLIK